MQPEGSACATITTACSSSSLACETATTSSLSIRRDSPTNHDADTAPVTPGTDGSSCDSCSIQPEQERFKHVSPAAGDAGGHHHLPLLLSTRDTGTGSSFGSVVAAPLVPLQTGFVAHDDHFANMVLWHSSLRSVSLIVEFVSRAACLEKLLNWEMKLQVF